MIVWGVVDLDPDHPVPDPAPLFAAGALHRLAAGGDPQARGRSSRAAPAAAGRMRETQMTGIASQVAAAHELPALRPGHRAGGAAARHRCRAGSSSSGYGNPWFDALEQARLHAAGLGVRRRLDRSSTSCSACRWRCCSTPAARAGAGRALALFAVQLLLNFAWSPSSSPGTRSAPALVADRRDARR